MTEDWLGRWNEGRTGWHEADGNSGLRAHWPPLPAGARVLVPMCGKAVDMLWLARRGLSVTGVELAEIAVAAFFAENRLDFVRERHAGQDRWRATGHDLTLVRGDYFEFDDPPFDALYDRGALVALPPEQRPAYVEHTRRLLDPQAFRMVITLEYDQSAAAGPPFAVSADEIGDYWPDLECVSRHNDIDNAPPKFRNAGLTEFLEVVRVSPRARG